MKKNLLFLFLCICSMAFSQDGPKTFTSIRFAGYEGKAGKPEIFFYAELDPSGLLKMQLNFRSRIQSYSYRLPDSTIQLARKLFDGSTALADHLVDRELVKGTHFSGSSFRYLEYEYSGKRDRISFVRYLLDDQLRSFVINLEEIFDREVLSNAGSALKMRDEFIKSLQQSHKNNRLLPTLD